MSVSDANVVEPTVFLVRVESIFDAFEITGDERWKEKDEVEEDRW